ncbi:MAG TPA: NAD(P)H-binding protein [Amycolatopsis sp.]|nr:NAD(P)H-binding protein [Amycolatopsis sp.]
MKVLVTGGTGTLGRVVADRLLRRGHEVHILSRRPAPPGTPYIWHTGDLRTRSGLGPATADVDTVVHCATAPRGDDESTQNLLASASGVGHFVCISIVGVDRIRFFYYQAKLRAERLIEKSAVPWTILRATQFHDLIATLTESQKRLPAVLTLDGRFQPVDVRDVADRLVALAEGAPAGRAPDLGGPEVRGARDLAQTYLRAVGRRRPVLALRLPGAAARAFRAGANLAPGHATGTITFEQFLAARRA